MARDAWGGVGCLLLTCLLVVVGFLVALAWAGEEIRSRL